MELGPVDVLVVKFPGNNFKGEILPALADLVDAGTIRIIDLSFVYRDDTGTVGGVELGGLAKEHSDTFTRLMGRIAGGILDDDDVEVVGAELEPNSSAAMLVIEHTWAIPFVTALERADGEIVSQARIPRDDIAAALG